MFLADYLPELHIIESFSYAASRAAEAASRDAEAETAADDVQPLQPTQGAAEER